MEGKKLGNISEPEPVNLIVGMLSSILEVFNVAETELEIKYGVIDKKSDIIPFTFTNYYNAEMGNNLARKFLSFKGLIKPEDIADIKIWTNNLEARISEGMRFNVKRAINLDPGYICKSKLVLATTKDYSHRIYLERGIFAEVTLQYHRSSFEPQSWTYCDYKTREYLEFFNKVRNEYLDKLNLSFKSKEK